MFYKYTYISLCYETEKIVFIMSSGKIVKSNQLSMLQWCICISIIYMYINTCLHKHGANLLQPEIVWLFSQAFVKSY